MCDGRPNSGGLAPEVVEVREEEVEAPEDVVAIPRVTGDVAHLQHRIERRTERVVPVAVLAAPQVDGRRLDGFREVRHGLPGRRVDHLEAGRSQEVVEHAVEDDLDLVARRHRVIDALRDRRLVERRIAAARRGGVRRLCEGRGGNNSIAADAALAARSQGRRPLDGMAVTPPGRTPPQKWNTQSNQSVRAASGSGLRPAHDPRTSAAGAISDPLRDHRINSRVLSGGRHLAGAS